MHRPSGRAMRAVTELLGPRVPASKSIGMNPVSQSNIVEALARDRPAFHLGGAAHWNSTPETLEAIRASVKPGDTTLETGVGASTVVFASAGAVHTAISPDPEEHRLVSEYCQRIGVEDGRVKFIAGASEDVLPSLCGRERTLDVAFIDGAHLFPLPAIDWYFVTRSLKVGGTLVIDDIAIPAVADIFRHMRCEPGWQLEGILDQRAAAFKLVAPPSEDEDWRDQRYNKNYPDYGFAAVRERVRLQAEFSLGEVRGRLSAYPALRSLRDRLR
jgi:predicted O-methyltransferase YrrM